MQIQQSSHQGSSVLTVSGRLDLAAVPKVQGAHPHDLRDPA
jgi:hypothetical protein